MSARSVIKNNVVTSWPAGANGMVMSGTASAATGVLPSGAYLGGDGSVAEGNIFTNDGGSSAIVMDYASGLHVMGNTISGVLSGSFSAPAVGIYGMTDSVIGGNLVCDIPDNAGFQLANGGPGTAVKCARLVITDNVLERGTGLEGLLIQDADSIAVTSNSVRSWASDAGICLQGVTNSLVANNVCNSNQNAGIKLENDGSSVGCTGNRVIGNTCRDDGSGASIDTGTGWTQQYGIQEAGNSNDNLFTLNECDSNAAGQLAISGAASFAWDNIISGTPTGTKTFTGKITSTTSGGAVSMANTVNGSGLVLTGQDYGGTATFRVVFNEAAWADSVDTAYFQADTAIAGFRNLTFQSGQSGSDTQFNRFQLNSLLSTITDGAFNATPVPTGLLELISATAAKVVLKVRGAASQSGNLQQWLSSTPAVLAYVDKSGDIGVAAIGAGLRVAEGSNAKQGTATLSGGTVVVANTSVTASSRILLTSNADGGTPGWLRVSARTAGTSFTITSSSGTDASTVAYQIFEPG
jgi:hypothetical protein